MADMVITPATRGLVPQVWDADFFQEYIRQSRFNKYMGTDEGAMIQIKKDLTRRPGDTVTFAAVRKLTGAGVTGDTLLEGNEEILDTRSMKLTVNPIRHAVAVTKWDEQQSAVPLRTAARGALKNWAMEKLRNDLIVGMNTVNGIPFATATSAQRDAWLAQNYDRVLFGAANSNNTGSTATSLQNVSTTTGKLTAAVISLAKRLAKTAHPAIRPITIKGDQEWYVMFVPSFAFRDLGNDPTIQTTYQYAAERGKDNILFTDDDIIIKGVIVREIPEFPVYPGLGASGTAIAPCLLMGAQAMGMAWAQTTQSTENVRDYGYRRGVGVEEIRGISKLIFGRNTAADTVNLVDQGMVTVFCSGQPDT